MARGGDTRPIIVKKVKKSAAAHHGGAWKVAYADFVTAMMAFFMLLWLLANPDKDRLKGLAKYFSPTIADSAPSTPVSNTAPGAGGPTRRSEADPSAAKGKPTFEVTTNGSARGGTADVPATMRVMASELMVALEATPQAQGKKNTDVKQDREGVRITLMDTDQQPMFKSNTAELNPYARMLLTKIASKIATVGAQIAIEGHTDGAGGQSDANWELSGQRALAARSALIAGGVTPDRFAEVVAMGATQPVYPDQPNRPENRRISIVLKGQTSALPSDASFKF
ncbi:flagellar motor protein MotB [uncultured Sphingomonas sp.]|uniref:OmpA family protein n=1 Tax=uncultured Sphingomonas sp. TaxID=158754 RepID=UPI0025F781E9|nr:flagellar motor protein MotB [uncultured Sphingomonas sp.]